MKQRHFHDSLIFIGNIHTWKARLYNWYVAWTNLTAKVFLETRLLLTSNPLLLHDNFVLLYFAQNCSEYHINEIMHVSWWTLGVVPDFTVNETCALCWRSLMQTHQTRPSLMCQTRNRTNTASVPIVPLATNFNWNLIQIQKCSFRTMFLKLPPAERTTVFSWQFLKPIAEHKCYKTLPSRLATMYFEPCWHNRSSPSVYMPYDSL